MKHFLGGWEFLALNMSKVTLNEKIELSKQFLIQDHHVVEGCLSTKAPKMVGLFFGGARVDLMALNTSILALN